MTTKGFTKMTDNQSSQIYGGSAIAILGSLLPIIIPAVTSLVSSFKLLFSDKGEVKGKDGTVTKWETHQDKSDSISKIHFIN